MKREIIIISDSGAITVQREVRVNIAQIAALLEIFYKTAFVPLKNRV